MSFLDDFVETAIESGSSKRYDPSYANDLSDIAERSIRGGKQVHVGQGLIRVSVREESARERSLSSFRCHPYSRNCRPEPNPDTNANFNSINLRLILSLTRNPNANPNPTPAVKTDRKVAKDQRVVGYAVALIRTFINRSQASRLCCPYAKEHSRRSRNLPPSTRCLRRWCWKQLWGRWRWLWQ